VGGPFLHVELPPACDKAMQRDGIEAKPPWEHKQLGEKAWWLSQMVGATPPGYWQDVSGLPPMDLLQLVRKSEWKKALLEGWSDAAERHHDPEWAEALLHVALVQPLGNSVMGFHAPLLEALNPDQREGFALRLLRENQEPLHGNHPALLVLQACQHPWSVEFARVVVDSLRRRLAAEKTRWDYALTEAVKQFGLYVPPEMLEEVSPDWPREGKPWEYYGSSVEEFLTLLQFRHDMLEEIAR